MNKYFAYEFERAGTAIKARVNARNSSDVPVKNEAKSIIISKYESKRRYIKIMLRWNIWYTVLQGLDEDRQLTFFEDTTNCETHASRLDKITIKL